MLLSPQGVIVGVNHPVLKFMGNLHERASRLQSTCPPNCIHVSSNVYEHSGERGMLPLPVLLAELQRGTEQLAVGTTQLHPRLVKRERAER